MEDIVAVEVETDRGRCYFITWGRTIDPVNPEPLERLILGIASRFATPGTPMSARLCRSLSEARDAPYFYEAILTFAREPIPFGDGYEAWWDQVANDMRDGKQIYFAGPTSAD